jgi:hypothetical protein
LRNVIKRIFGVLKRQWQILRGYGCEYSINTQTDLFCALVGLYNFERDYNKEETFEGESVKDKAIEIQSDSVKVIYKTRNKWIKQKRDKIANRM